MRPRKVRSLPLYAAVPIAILAVWEVVGRDHLLANGLFPPASDVASALADWIAGVGGTGSIYSATWLPNAAASASRIAVGFLIGGSLGVVLGVLVGWSPTARRLFDPTVNAVRPIAVTAWVPIALMIFGIGNKPAYFLTALASFFPVYVNTVSGVRYADARLARAARMLGASERQILRRVLLPAALPSIMTGVRVAIAIAWTTVIVVEILGAKSGLGYVLIDTYQQFQFPYVIAAMISVGALGFLSDLVVVVLSRRRLRWAGGSQ
jgi:ABC-type nitrate/sulfonate/bicarbonate transport system permease component